MEHDFEGGNLNRERFSKKGEPCTGIGGYMDYRDNPTKWSPCSAEDFYAYFSAFDRPGYVCLGNSYTTNDCTHFQNVINVINISN